MNYHYVTESIVLVCLFILCIAKFYWSRRKLYRLARNIPGTDGYPIIGNALDFLENSTEGIFLKVLQYFNTNPEIFKYWVGPKLIVGVSEPESLEIILNHNQCLEKDPLYDILKPLLGNGIFSAPVKIWKRNRKLINPFFKPNVLESFSAVFVKNSKILVEVLEQNVKNDSFNIYQKFNNCTVSVMNEIAMGVKVNAHLNTQHYGRWLVELLPILLMRMTNVSYRYDFLFKWNKYKSYHDEMHSKISSYIMNVVNERLKSFKRNVDVQKAEYNVQDDGTIPRKSFLDWIIHLSDYEEKFTVEETKDEIATFLVGGTESTATTMSFCSMLLGMHPDIQQRVYEEIMNIVEEDNEITHEDLPHLKYLEKCIKETMRLFPLVPLIMRKSTADINLGNCIIPEGSTILICIIHNHRSPKYWIDPLKFDPDRFSSDETRNRHPYLYIPFSAGSRGCIGSRFAMMAMKMVLSNVVRKFLLKTQYKSVEEVDLKTDIALKPVYGYKVSVEPRIQ